MMHPISRRELWQAQSALLIAIVLQFTISTHLIVGPKYLITGLELLLVFGIGLTAPRRHSTTERIHRTISIILIALISIANAGALVLVADALLNGSVVPGHSLLAAAFAIFITNIVVFSLWYWELDSPGLTGLKKHDAEPKFDFPQMESKVKEAASWEPTFTDYLYVSITNASAFSPTDAMPLTHAAKALMSAQSIISLLTVILVTARAVNILG